MRAVSRAVGDVGLVVFGVLVVVGAVAAVKQGGAAGSSRSVAVVTDAPTATTAPSATAAPTLSPAATASGVLVVGPDLAKLTAPLASVTGYHVLAAASAAPAVIAPGALDEVTGTPSAVVLEVLAGSKTTTRTTAAITAVTAKWPDAHVIVVGPFSSADRKSAAAAKTAAVAAKATFLDPVELSWRPVDTSAVLTAADEKAVTAKLATALA